MNHQLLPAQALVQQMIRNKLVQHIHLIRIVIIIQRPLHVVIQPGLTQIVTHILHTDVSSRLTQQLLPHTVRLHKQRIAIVPVRRNRTRAGRVKRRMRRQILHTTRQIQHLPRIITEGIQRIHQPAGNHQPGHHTVTALRMAGPQLQEITQPVIAGSNHSLHLVNKTVRRDNTPVRH